MTGKIMDSPLKHIMRDQIVKRTYSGRRQGSRNDARHGDSILDAENQTTAVFLLEVSRVPPVVRRKSVDDLIRYMEKMIGEGWFVMGDNKTKWRYLTPSRCWIL